MREPPPDVLSAAAIARDCKRLRHLTKPGGRADIVSWVSSLPITPAARAAGILAWIETGLLCVYCVALAIAGINSTGAKTSAPVVEIIIYLIFAAGIGLVARATLAGSNSARPPYFLTQIFVIVIGGTVFAGDGTAVKLIGAAIVVIGLVGIVLGAAAIRSQDEPHDVSDAL